MHGVVRAAVRSQANRDWALAAEDAARAAGIDPKELAGSSRSWSSWSRRPPPPATLADVVAHVEHVRDVAGIDHVGLGGDYDGVTTLPEGLEDVSCYPGLLEALAGRGWSAEDLGKLACRNVLGLAARPPCASVSRTARVTMHGADAVDGPRWP